MDPNTPQNYQPLPQVPQMPAQTAYNPPQYQPPPPSGGKKKMILIAVLLAVLIIGVVGAVLAVVLPRLGGGGGDGSIEITYWGLWEDDSVITPLIAEYENDNPNITINYQSQSLEDYRERLTSSMARGTAPDIFRIHNTWTPMFYSELALLPEEIMTEEEYKETFFPAAVESLSTPEGIGGIPLMFDSLGLFVNQDIFTAFSETTPDLWNEFRQTATNLTLRESATNSIQQAGAALGYTGNIDYWPEILIMLTMQNQADLVEPSSSLSTNAMKYYLQYGNVDQIWNETLADSTVAFSTGKLAMLIAPSYVSQEILATNPNLRFKVHPVPQVPKFDIGDPDTTYATFWAEGVWNGSENSEEAWKFLKYLSSQESLRKLYEKTKEPYPRQDMRTLLLNDPYYGATMRTAKDARSWYVASKTLDGENGLNTQLINTYEAFLAPNIGKSSSFTNSSLDGLSRQVKTILARYGLAAPPPPLED